MKRWLMLVIVATIGVTSVDTRGAGRTSVWIDTDPAMGEPERAVDDGLALIQAFNSPELDLKGVSVVHGNAALDRALPIAQQLVSEFGPVGLNVYAGAANAGHPYPETAASARIAEALRRASLTIVALGPLTNVATVLTRHGDLRNRITRVIAVAGRRPGQRFTTGLVNATSRRDFNLELDPLAFQLLLDSGVDVVLVPMEIAAKIWVESGDLDRLAASGSPSARAIVPAARNWLALWTRQFEVGGFNPFDTLAVAYAISSDGFGCQRLPARIDTLPDDATENGASGRDDLKPYLLVASDLTGTRSRVTYCAAAPAGFKADLLKRLTGPAGQPK